MIGKESIDFPEFLIMMASRIKNSNTDEELREAFQIFDKDGDGLIRLV